MRIYEELFILRTGLPEEEVTSVIAQITGVITTGGGTIEKNDNWGVRKLAYRVKKQVEGVYVLIQIVTGVIAIAGKWLILGRMKPQGRVAVCGLISGYNGKAFALTNVRSILVNKLMIQGFIISDHFGIWPQAHKELADLVVAKKLHYRESITEGIANAPRAFLGLLKGENFGKQVVKL